jgi:excisionase family DNA binding protein
MQPTKISQGKILLSRVESAEALSISVSSLDRLISKGELKARKLGDRVLIEPEELERFARRGVRLGCHRSTKDAAANGRSQSGAL